MWAAQFSPVDQAVATASGDKTLRLWALADGSCLRTFEGHTASVLRLNFLSAGTQVSPLQTDSQLGVMALCSGPNVLWACCSFLLFKSLSCCCKAGPSLTKCFCSAATQASFSRQGSLDGSIVTGSTSKRRCRQQM